MDWHETGHVARLKDGFTVITVDLRGHGESDKPTDPAMYTTDKMRQDILAVVDACTFERFILWGYSFGGNVGRYLAACSNRVSKMIMLGNRLSGVSDEHRQFVFDFRTRWTPVIEAARVDGFDPRSLSQKDQEDIAQLSFPSEQLPVVLAWTIAMLDWDMVAPDHLRCPTLWLIGSKNEKAMESFNEYEKEIPGSNVQVHILKALTHGQEFENIDQVLPFILDFVRG